MELTFLVSMKSKVEGQLFVQTQRVHLRQQLELELKKTPNQTVDQTALSCIVENNKYKKQPTAKKALSLNQDYCTYQLVFAR